MKESPESKAAAPVHVRRATASDQPALGRLGALLIASHHAFDPQRFIPAGPGSEQGYGRFLAGQLKRSDAVVLVAESEGAVIGYALGRLEDADWMILRGPAGVLHDIIVDPDARRRGAAQLLLDAVIAALQALGAPRIMLSTAAKNEAAQKLFARNGFRPTMFELTRELP